MRTFVRQIELGFMIIACCLMEVLSGGDFADRKRHFWLMSGRRIVQGGKHDPPTPDPRLGPNRGQLELGPINISI